MTAKQVPFDLQRARRDTRACGDLIHFNNAGAALMPAPVADCLHEYLYKEEQIGGYETQNAESALLDNFYHATASLLNCKSTEIAFMESATKAWDMAFYSLRLSSGDKILTTISEYGSNVIAYLHQVKRRGILLEFVPNDASGKIDTHALEGMIDERVKLISINHIPTGSGMVNPAAKVGRIANTAGIPFMLDACQSLGQIPIDVDELGCDMLTGTGRKYLRGPRGTGLLYVRSKLIKSLDPPFLDQHAAQLTSPSTYTVRQDAKRFEAWEQNCAGKAALGTAIDYALSYGLPEINSRVCELAEYLRTQLGKIDSIKITDDGDEKCAIVTFLSTKKSTAEIKTALNEYNINVTTPTGSGSLVSFMHRGLKSVVRASLHYYNTKDEIDYFVEHLQVILLGDK